MFVLRQDVSKHMKRLRVHIVEMCGLALLLVVQGWPQHRISDLDRGRAQDMLRVVADEVRKHYDPKLHGIDWDPKVAEAKQRIEKATSMNMALSEIAGLLNTLNDSHTFFVPPQHADRFDHGWQYQMIGEKCFVTRVRPKSDAALKGLKPGDEILALDGYRPTRENVWKMQYVYSVLRPQPGFRLGLRDPAGSQRELDVATKIHERKRVTNLTFDGMSDIWGLLRENEAHEQLMRLRYAEISDQLIAVKLPEFFSTLSEIETMIDRVRKYPALIVDVRGNPGGASETLKYLVGGMFDKEVTIDTRNGRRESKPEVAKPGRHPFLGKLAVLVDSNSASAAEIFARVVQLEKRGLVVGERTSGSVMEAKHYNEKMGTDTEIFYGVSVTEWAVTMSDGKGLEHVGVIPDEIVVPTAQDLASNSDPMMARAAETLGVKLSPEEASKLFPYEWPPD